MICRAVLPSETYAHKAQKVLASRGYPCEIFHNISKKNGCGFGLKVTGDCEEIHKILIQKGIPVQTVRIEREYQ